MSRPRLLVATSVHQPDDARIRAKLIPTLARDWDVYYAARDPGPTDHSDLTWLPLEGGRAKRSFQASRLILRPDWDLVAFHDPELLLAGLARSRRGRPTLFDLHENLPAQLLTRDRIPRPLRRPASSLARWILRMAETTMAITLAEEGYQSLFRAHHPVIANHLPPEVPEPRPPADPPFLAYLGDITAVRGAFLALEAAAGAGTALLMVGRVSPPGLENALRHRAEELGIDLTLTGPLPHREALERIAPALGGLSPLLDIGNYRHSLPTKVPEYLALGLPVLASDLPGTRAPTGGLKAVALVEPGNVEAWRQAGRDLAADAGVRAVAQAQIETVRERFTWSEDEVRAIYRRAARR